MCSTVTNISPTTTPHLFNTSTRSTILEAQNQCASSCYPMFVDLPFRILNRYSCSWSYRFLVCTIFVCLALPFWGFGLLWRCLDHTVLGFWIAIVWGVSDRLGVLDRYLCCSYRFQALNRYLYLGSYRFRVVNHNRFGGVLKCCNIVEPLFKCFEVL